MAAQRTDSQQSEDLPEQLTAPPASHARTLRECVSSTVEHYLRDLDGYEVNDLYQVVMGEVEPPLLETLLDYTHGNQTRAARLLGLSRSTLRKKMAHYEIRRHT